MAHGERQALYWKHKPFPELVRLAWPIAVSMLSYSIMTLTDTLFVGRLGASALAGVGLGGVAGFAVLCFGFGLVRGVKVLVSQAAGAGRRHELPALVSAGVVTALGLGGLVVVVGRAVAHLLPSLSVDAEAGALAAVYLGIRILGAPLFLLAAALRESRYGMGDTRVPMIAALVANIANIPLDALLIFGLHQGVAGAAWATLIASAVQAGILLAGQLGGEGLALSRVRREHLLELWHIGAPLGVQMLLEVGSFATLVVLLARIGEVDLAAHQVALQVTHLSFLPALALGEAASVLTGQAVGAGEDELVRRVAHRALAAAAVYSGTCAVVFVVAARSIAAIFTPDPAVQSLAVKLLYVAAAFQVFDGANVVARCVLRGTGDVRFPAIIAVATSWLCTPPLTALLGIGLGLGAVGGWLGLCAEICIGAALFWWRIERRRWQPWAERSRQRLARSRRRAALPVAA